MTKTGKLFKIFLIIFYGLLIRFKNVSGLSIHRMIFWIVIMGLKNYPSIEWKKVMGMRDIITHHYFDIDAETVFTVCDDHIPELEKVINRIKNDVSGDT